MPNSAIASDRSKSICFTGYRPCKYNYTTENKAAAYFATLDLLRPYVAKGYDTFYYGGAPGFDLLAALAVVELKREHDLKLICALPYHGFSGTGVFNAYDRAEYEALMKYTDEVINVTNTFVKSSGSYMVRNRFMVDRSSVLVCFFHGQKGGTANTLRYASAKKLEIVNVLELVEGEDPQVCLL